MPNIAEIIDRLSSDDPDVVREAAYEAGEALLAEAVPHLARHAASQNLGVQEAVDRALRKIGGRAVVAAVIPLLRSDEAPARNIAMDILRDVGAQDFPSLVALLHDPDPDIRIFGADILGSTANTLAVAPLGEALLKDPEVNVRYQAAVSLGELGFAQAARHLNKALLDDEWVQFAVIEALAKIRDASSVGALAKALAKSTDLVASMIVEALGDIGNLKAVGLLLRRMDASPAVLRNKIVKAVVTILGGKSLTLLSGKDLEKFRDYLLSALSDDDPDIQDAAVTGLAGVGGEKAVEAILALAAGIDPDVDPDRREHALRALASMGLAKALETGLMTGAPRTRAVAVEVLSRVGGPEASELLMRAYPETEDDLSRQVARALVQVGGPEAGPFFMGVLGEAEDPELLIAAMDYLGRKARLAESGDKLFSLLDHPLDEVKEAALNACVALGGEEMNTRFKAFFRSPDPVERLMAVYALGKMGVRDNLDEIALALKDDIPDIRKIALEALTDLCPDDDRGLALIVSRLHDESRDVRLAVIEQIGKCSLTAGGPYLIEALDDQDDWVRVRALEALAARSDEGTIPRIVPLLSDPSRLVALKAVETLGDIGGTSAFRALLDIMSGDDAELVQAAEAAAAKIQDGQGES